MQEQKADAWRRVGGRRPVDLGRRDRQEHAPAGEFLATAAEPVEDCALTDDGLAQRMPSEGQRR